MLPTNIDTSISDTIAPTLDWKALPSHVAEGPAEVRHVDGWLVCEVPSDSYARLIAAAPRLFSGATLLIAAIDELRSMTVAERIIIGRSTDDLRKASDAAIAELRAAISAAEGK